MATRARRDAAQPTTPSDEDRPRPYVIVDFVFEAGLFTIAIENIGDRPAIDVSIRFDKEFHGPSGQAVSKLGLFRKIPFLAPRRRIVTFLDSSAAYFARREPTDITAAVVYADASGTAFKDTMHHDLAIYRDVSYVSPPGEEE
jgi:hypothetical protein